MRRADTPIAEEEPRREAGKERRGPHGANAIRHRPDQCALAS